MSEKYLRRCIVLGITIVLTLSMSLVSVFAAGPNATPDGTSYNRQTSGTSPYDTGTITLGKILTVNQANKFPKVNTFTYTVTPYAAWKNANASTSASGETITVANMPLPTTSNTQYHTITNDTTNHVSTVTIGNFDDSTGANTSTGDVTDTTTQRSRTTAVPIDFSSCEAGYYVYKITETGSDPANVKGVTYDTHDYYVVFYVCNNVDSAGNTATGVYVHDITSYRNEENSTTNYPTLSDIQSITDNNNANASANTESNLGKVGYSATNSLEAYRMWNSQVTHDVVITKNVTGNLGDRTKYFEFTVVLTGLEPTQTYTTTVASEDNNVTSNVTIDSMTSGKGTLGTDGTSFTPNAAGEATFLVKLRDEERLVINALPMTSTYTVTEAASDHVASYVITSSNTTGTGDEVPVIANSSANNATGWSSLNTTLATQTETVNQYDGEITIAFSNNRDIATITGIPGLDYIIYAAVAAALVAIAFVIVRRRREYDDEI